MKGCVLVFFLLVALVGAFLPFPFPSEREIIARSFGSNNPPVCHVLYKPVTFPTPLPLSVQAGLLEATSLIELLLNKFNKTAITAAIVYDQQVLWTFADGPMDPKRPSKGDATIDSIFRVGSLSKMFTVLMLLKLRDQGKVLLDEEVQKYWPNFQPGRFQNSRGITFLELGRQLSGLPSGTPCNYFNNSCNLTTFEAFEKLSALGQALPSDIQPHYSDVAYAVLGRALEKIAGMTWEDYMQQEIFKPLQLTSTGFEFTPQIISQMPVPMLGGYLLPDDISFIDMLWARPTGQIFSSVRDLAKVASMFFADRDSVPNPILKDSSLREIMLPGLINDDQINGFGFPWEIKFNKATNTYLKTKGGLFPGYTSSIMLDPSTKLGVVAQNNDVLAISAAAIIVNTVFPPLKKFIQQNQPPLSTPANASLFVGTYKIVPQILPWLNLNISVSLNKTSSSPFLNLVLSQQAYALAWQQGNVFRLSFSGSLPCVSLDMSNDGELVVFQTTKVGRSNDQAVQSLQLPTSDPWTQYIWTKVE